MAARVFLGLGLCLASPVLAAPSAVSVGYLGEFAVHPGVFGAMERPVAESPLLSLGLGGRGGVYHHPRHHTGLVLTGELTGRAATEKGLFGELALGLGLRHRFLDGPVYVADGNGAERSVDLGRPTALSTVALGGGWTVARDTDRPVRVFARVESWVSGPVNRRAVPGQALTVGAAWTLGRSE